MAKLYANENFTKAAVLALRALGYDVLTTLDTGKAGQKIPDEAVLAFSTAEERILITFNRRDFIRLAGEMPQHAGIIVCTFDADSSALAARIQAVLESNPDMRGKLERVNRPNLSAKPNSEE